MTPEQRKALKARAHPLHPVVMISSAGLSEGVLNEIERGLKSHELIKIRVFGDDRDVRAQFLSEICERTGAQPVQHIGKILVIYRENPEQRTDSTGTGPRGKWARNAKPAKDAKGVKVAKEVRLAKAAKAGKGVKVGNRDVAAKRDQPDPWGTTDARPPRPGRAPRALPRSGPARREPAGARGRTRRRP